jgi:hypothetical protein
METEPDRTTPYIEASYIANEKSIAGMFSSIY